jgi:hypothetical protein
VRPFIYATTKSGLTPVQAQIELALTSNRGLPDALFEIDVEGLRKIGINPILGPRSVAGGNFGAGGGVEIIFNKPIPAKYLIRLK